MTRQERYRDRYRAENPQWLDSPTVYRETIEGLTGPETRILDIGCGHRDTLKNVYAVSPHSYGLDPDTGALAKNTVIRNRVQGSADSIPFGDNFFDLVVMEWVAEHLEQPELSFSEIHRVLKPGGKVVFLTPNVWNYNVWMIRAIPNRFHGFFTSRLYKRGDGDTYPVRYRVNSARRVESLLGGIGFTKDRLILNGDPTYISFNEVLYKLACLLERILQLKPLRFANVHLIGVYEKL